MFHYISSWADIQKNRETLGIYKQRAFTFLFLSLIAVGLRCCARAFSVAGGSSPWWLLLVAEPALGRSGALEAAGPRGLEYRFSSCGVQAFFASGHGIFLDREWNP